MHAISTNWSNLNDAVANQVLSWYNSLMQGSQTFAAAILFATICLSLLVMQRAQRVGYVNRAATPLAYHYCLITASALSVVFLIYLVITGRSIATLLVALVGIFSIVGLLKFRVVGVASSILFFWIFGWILVRPNVLAALADKNEIASYSGIDAIAVYAASDIIIVGALGVELLLCCFTVFTVRYYTQRRFLFPFLKHSYLDQLAQCPHCGLYAVSEKPFCTFCGEGFDDGAYTVPSFKLLDKPRYEETIAEKGVAKTIREKTVDEIKDGFGVPIATVVLAIILVIVPSSLMNVSGYLITGSAAASNAYVEKLKELGSNPEVSKDEQWLSTYNDAAGNLYDVNIRVYDINARRIAYDDLLFYLNYSEATRSQMLAMDDIADAINEQNYDALPERLTRYDGTLDLQMNALVGALNTSISALQNESKLAEFPHILVDSLRFFTSFLPLNVWAGIVLVLSFGFLFLALKDIKKQKGLLKKPYELPVLSIKAGKLTESQVEYQKDLSSEKKLGFVAGLVGAAFVLAIAWLPNVIFHSETPNALEECESAVSTCVIDVPNEIITWLNDVQTAPDTALTPDEINRITLEIDKQITAFNALENADESALSADGANFRNEILLYKPEADRLLPKLRDTIAAGNVPTPDEAKAISKLEANLLLQGSHGYLKETIFDLLS